MTQTQPIELLLADVDGTLVNHDKLLTPRAIAAVGKARDAGIELAITSGRPPKGMAMLIEPLAIATPVAGFNGGLIVRPDLSPIEARTLPDDVTREAVALLRAAKLDVWVYAGEHWYVTDPKAPHVEHESFTVQFAPNVIATLDDKLNGVVKIVGVSDDLDLVQRTEAAAQQIFGAKATVARSQPYYLDITHRDANKGAVLDYLARTLHLHPSQIATIGDQPNDVMMFRRSGYSVAMGNASDEVKHQADLTTQDSDHEGFAIAVERLVAEHLAGAA